MRVDRRGYTVCVQLSAILRYFTDIFLLLYIPEGDSVLFTPTVLTKNILSAKIQVKIPVGGGGDHGYVGSLN